MNLFPKEKTRAVHSSVNPQLHEELEQVKLQMETAYTNFQNSLDPDLIDCYIFEANAAWKRYRFLLKQLQKQA